jgi:hypothetical protein
MIHCTLIRNLGDFNRLWFFPRETLQVFVRPEAILKPGSAGLKIASGLVLSAKDERAGKK